ncbi:MAG: nucleotidyltransferase domain-containing protein [Candidatus Bathyarchaeia archaeon]
MKKYFQEDYYNAVSELVDVVTKRYGNKVKAIYAGGSFARGDFVPGRSDIDLYVVGENKEEEMQEELREKALEIEKKYFEDLRSVFDEVLGISVTTLTEIKGGRSFLGAGFEYSNFIQTGKLLWGEDIKSLIPQPSLEKQKETAKNCLQEIYKMVSNQERNFKWIKWIPFKLVPRKYKERWARQAFCLSFRTTALFLGSKGVYVSKKEDIASAFKQYRREKGLCSMLFFALSLWEKWKEEPLSDEEIKLLLENSLRFVKELQLLK